MRWAARSCTHHWPSANPGNRRRSPRRPCKPRPRGSPGSGSTVRPATRNSASSCSLEARSGLTRKSIEWGRLLARAKASAASTGSHCNNSAASQSGRERRRARHWAASAGSSSPCQGSVPRLAAGLALGSGAWLVSLPWRLRRAERSRALATGARRARPPLFASSTVVLTAADAGTRSLNNS